MAQMYLPLLYYVSPQLQHVGALHKRRRQFGGTEGSDLIEICQQTEVKTNLAALGEGGVKNWKIAATSDMDGPLYYKIM